MSLKCVVVPWQVNEMWAGLGYYRRARMLHAGAKVVHKVYEP